jgi:Cu/Ag efflux pump CusA
LKKEKLMPFRILFVQSKKRRYHLLFRHKRTITDTIFSMQAFIGCIKLSGSRRLRPILMTTLTTVLGLLPLSFGLGEGGESQAPLARVVIGGLMSSTLITLVLIPVIYAMFEERVKRKV